MGFWNSWRRLSHSMRKQQRSTGGGKKPSTSRNRELRMEQFEQRMLLSINPTGVGENPVWEHMLGRSIERAADLENYTQDKLEATQRWTVGIAEGYLPEKAAATVGADSLQRVEGLPSAYVWEFSINTSWTDAVSQLSSSDAVSYFYPLVELDRELRFTPDDTLLGDQWHLINTGQTGGTAGADANVAPAWDLTGPSGDPIRGEGVVIGIVDDGLDYLHPDLANQYRSDLSYDFNNNDPDPIHDSPFDAHGTSVAGVAGAAGNNGQGVAGSAIEAELAGLRLLSGFMDDATEAAALLHTLNNPALEDIAVFNNSWGPADAWGILGAIGPAAEAALQYGVTNGRGGLGAIYTWAGGNGGDADNVNFDAYANSRYTIAVGAIDHNGVRSSYSEAGSPLLISAYSSGAGVGITTTDRVGADGYAPGDYTSDFGGTSSATPLVSGVVALMLEANPNLTYRDVQHILVTTAEQNDPSHPDWSVNAAGYHVNHYYGFGAIDAAAAVEAALTWQTIGPEQSAISGLDQVGMTIPDGGSAGVARTLTLPDSFANLEWVEVILDVDHPNPADLEIILTSPSGSDSVLAPADTALRDSYSSWKLTSARHWGEEPGGEWQLTIRDRGSNGFSGTWNSWEMAVYGAGDTVASTPPELVMIESAPLEQLYNAELHRADDGLIRLHDAFPNHRAPEQLLFRFAEGQAMDADTLAGGIQIVRAGGDGMFGDAGDVLVEYGWIGLADRDNEVIARFSQPLVDDVYRIYLIGDPDDPSLPDVLADTDVPLSNQAGIPFHATMDDDSHWVPRNLAPIQFDLDLGAKVTAVVPQPVSRDRVVTIPADTTLGAGDLFTLRGGVVEKTFELTTDGNVSGGHVAVLITPDDGAEQIAAAMKLAIDAETDLGLSVVQNGSQLTLSGMWSQFVQHQVRVQMVVGTALADKDQFVVTDDRRTLVFEFDRDTTPGVIEGHVAVPFSRDDTAIEIARKVADAIEEAGMRLDVVVEGDTLTLRGAKAVFDFDPRRLPLGVDRLFAVEDGDLRQYRGAVEVYFNDDPFSDGNSLDTRYFRLIATNNTADNRDDTAYQPQRVDYDPVTNKAILWFDVNGDAAVDPTDDLAEWRTERLPGAPEVSEAFRLRVGDVYRPVETWTTTVSEDAGSSFETATDGGWTLGVDAGGGEFGSESLIIRGGAIQPTLWDMLYTLEFPGGVDEPGHRELPDGSTHHYEDHYYLPGDAPADATPGITTLYYNFRDDYGVDPYGNPLHNLITESQKDRAREVFELLGNYMGVQFVETEPGMGEYTGPNNLTIATGDIRSIKYGPWIDPYPIGDPLTSGLTTGAAGPHPRQPWAHIPGTWLISPYSSGQNGAGEFVPLALVSNAVSWGTSEYGVGWFTTAMHEVMHLLGLGHSYDQPALTIMGEGQEELDLVGQLFGAEPIFPGNADIVHGQYMYRPDSNDIDIYQFSVETAGWLSAETLAERLDEIDLRDGLNQRDSSLLDSVLTLYDENRELIARNDDYYSEDSALDLYLQPGSYYIAVTSTGNIDFDPTIENTGFGGTTQGDYELRLSFTPDVEDHLADATGTLLDGDADGTPGGNYNFWFNVQSEENTIFVDKVADPTGADGTLEHPYTTIPEAFAAAAPEDIVRILGNAGDDGEADSLVDNRAYEIGRDIFNNPLSDNWRLEVPKGVTMMVDAGAVFKLRGANIDVGSSAEGINRSLGHLQVLGTPYENAYFTSYFNELLGYDTQSLSPTLSEGDWGGLVFRNELDYDEIADGNANYQVRELDGIFLNYVGYADISHGGGAVRVNSIYDIYNPIHMIEARPTVSYNNLHHNADSALSADPNSFLDNKFQNYFYTADYQRVGPDIDGNRVVDNSINGLMVRIDTVPGENAEKLEVFGRFDDRDIVHVISENLAIQAAPGGPVQRRGTSPLSIASDLEIQAVSGPYLTDGDWFKLTTVGADGTQQSVEFEFDTVSGVLYGRVPIPFVPGRNALEEENTAETIAERIAAAINSSRNTLVMSDPDGNLHEIDVATGRVTGHFTPGVSNIDGGSAVVGDEIFLAQYDGPRDRLLVYTRAGDPVRIIELDYAVVALGGDRYDAATSNNRLFAIPDDGTQSIVELNPATGAELNRFAMPEGIAPLPINGLAFNGTSLFFTRGIGGTLYELNPDTGATIAAHSLGSGNFRGLAAIGDRIYVTNAMGGSIVEFDPVADVVTNTLDIEGLNPGVTIGMSLAGIAGGRPLALTATAVADRVMLVPDVGTEVLLNGFTQRISRQDARLRIDPGVIVKLNDSRIEAEKGTQLLAEGKKDAQIIFTSLMDTRYGTGGTFATKEIQDPTGPEPGDWGGLYFGPTAEGSLDQTYLAYAGGPTAIEGGFANFSPIEVHQAKFRLANSILEQNSGGIDPGNRDGRGPVEPATIFVRGAQPVIVENIIRDNPSPAISIDVNSLNGQYIRDWGGSVGAIQAEGNLTTSTVQLTERSADNRGPMVRRNRMAGNEINGMVIRGGTLTTQGVWDDTDIAHVLFEEVVIPDHHTYSGLRLQSSSTESLVVKMRGSRAGFTAMGSPQDVDDRLGGSLQIIGTPGHPVMLTSIADDSRPAGFTPEGLPLFDTNNDRLQSAPDPGDWRSVRLQAYSNDRNVQVIQELEPPVGIEVDQNGEPVEAQWLGELSDKEQNGDDNVRLGFEVHGYIRLDDPADMDVYSFQASPGTEVWLDIDRTTHSLDTIVELVDADGNVFASSDNSYSEQFGLEADDPAADLFGLAMSMDRDSWETKDTYTTNPRDAGMRVVVPGPAGAGARFYYVRVRSAPHATSPQDANQDGIADGITKGSYQLQLRLRELQELPGSNLRHSHIEFATNGIELFGLPTHSPLVGESAETIMPNESLPDAQYIGNLLASDRNTITVGGRLDGPDDVDWYQFDLDVEKIQDIEGVTPESSFWPVMFDIDYADGMERPDTTLWVYGEDALTGELKLIYRGRNSNNVDDYPGVNQGADLDDLSRGSVGPLDPFIGTTYMAEGEFTTYYAAISNQAQVASAIGEGLGRLEPIRSTYRIAQEHIDVIHPDDLGSFHPTAGMMGLPEQPDRLFLEEELNAFQAAELSLHVQDYSLADVPLFILGGGFDPYQGEDVYVVDGFTGAFETDVTGPNSYGPNGLTVLPDVFEAGYGYGDLGMRDDGHLYSLNSRYGLLGDQDPFVGRYREFDTGDGTVVTSQDDGIDTFQIGGPNNDQVVGLNSGVRFDAFAMLPSAYDGPVGPNHRLIYAVGSLPPGNGVEHWRNLMYWMTPDGVAGQFPADDLGDERIGTDIIPMAELFTAPTLVIPAATDISWTYDDDVEDGMTITVVDRFPAELGGPNTLTFELDSGPDVRFLQSTNRVSLARDGETFMLDDGDANNGQFGPLGSHGTIYELESGPVMMVGLEGLGYQGMVDGATFYLREFDPDPGDNEVAEEHTFEFEDTTLEDDDPGVGVVDGNVTIEFDPAWDSVRMMQAIVDAVNGAGWTFADPMADFVVEDVGGELIGRISFLYDDPGSLLADPLLLNYLTIEGQHGSNGGPASNTVLVPFEETWPIESFGAVLTTVVANGNPVADPNFSPLLDPNLNPGYQGSGIFPGYAHRNMPQGWLPFDAADPDTYWYAPVAKDRVTFYGAVDYAFEAAPAKATVTPLGINNDIIFRSSDNGALYNGVQIVFVNSGAPGTQPVVTYNDLVNPPVLSVEINPYDPLNPANPFTTAQQVVDAVNAANLADPIAMPFQAGLDTGESAGGNDGSGAIWFDINNPGNLGWQATTWGGTTGVGFFQHVAGTEHGIADSSDYAIPFDADDTASVLANKIFASINAAFTTNENFTTRALLLGSSIQLAGAETVTVNPAGGPIEVEGEGQGGQITGMAFLEVGGAYDLYCVDDLGGLYRIDNLVFSAPDSPAYYNFDPWTDPSDNLPKIIRVNGRGPQLTYLGKVGGEGRNIEFSGLTAGPRNVEGGRYAEMFFATDTGGNLYAFDGNAQLQPVFLDGASSIYLDGVYNPTGLAFSNIDYNLWHVSSRRSGEDHGIFHSYDGTRPFDYAGRQSFYFGLEHVAYGLGVYDVIQPGTNAYLDRSPGDLDSYDVPAGTHGSLVTDTFSLVGYDAADEPTLYFTYFLDTEETSDFYDTARVFISNDGAQWNRLMQVPQNAGDWRQARINLGGYVGMDNLRLRFDFSTAGDLRIGPNPFFFEPNDELIGGTYFHALPGTELADGDRFMVDGEEFEIDMGFSLYLPNAAGAAIQDGERFTVTTATGSVTFEFDKGDGTIDPASDQMISIPANDPTSNVVQRVLTALTTHAPDAMPELFGNRISLPGALDVQGDYVVGQIGGSPDIAPEAVIPVGLFDTDAEVAHAIAIAIDQVFTGTRDIAAPEGDQFADQTVFAVSDHLNTVRFEINMGLKLVVPENAQNLNLDGQRFTVVDGDGNEVTFELDTNDSYSPSHTPINVNGLTDVQIAEAIHQALMDEPGLNFTGFDVARMGQLEIDLRGAIHAEASSGLLSQGFLQGNDPGQIYDGGAVEVYLHESYSAADVAEAVADAINLAQADPRWRLEVSAVALGDRIILTGRVARLDPGNTPLTLAGAVDEVETFTSSKVDAGLIHMLGHEVDDPGPFPFSDSLPGDYADMFYLNPEYGLRANTRGQANAGEGFYIDDIIIGFAERGELVTNVSDDVTFSAVPIGYDVLEGEYQLEIRRGTEYAPGAVSWDTNDRLRDGLTLKVPEPIDIGHGDSFTVSDGVNGVTYQFLDPSLPPLYGGVPIYFRATETAGDLANRIADAVNTATALRNVSAVSIETSDRVDLFGAAWVDGIDYIVFGKTVNIEAPRLRFPQGPVEITGRVDAADPSAGNQLRDMVVGDGIQIIGDAIYVGGSSSVPGQSLSSGFWSDGVNSGIVLTTGDVLHAEGPNDEDSSSATASDLPDPYLFGSVDSSSLEFNFVSTGGDLYFDFVFASEEYNEFVGSAFNDQFGFFVDGFNVALIPDTTEEVSINTVNNTSHRIYYNDNTDGAFTQWFGYDGFTHVLTAEVLGLEPGVHTFRMTVADVGDSIYDSAVLLKAGSFRGENIGFTVDHIPSEIGDQNQQRDQGWTVIERNTVMNSSGWGIYFNAGTRDGEGAGWPHAGPTMPLREINTEGLVPGITIQNNLLAYNGNGGIRFSGDANPLGSPTAAVPFGRIVNNTIFGGLTGTGGGGQSEFDIDVIFGDGLSEMQQAVFAEAAARWEQIIIGDLPDISTDIGLVDDVAIDASGEDIDGPGGILGQAGPRMLRPGTYLPARGVMMFDTADLDAMEANGSLVDVIMHEMAHVLGFGTIWGNLGLVTGTGGDDPQFTGAGATAEYNDIFANADPSVPVENTGGPGTRNSHWRESIFNNELMTGWLNQGVNPLSRVSAASMGDLGYEVDINAADDFAPLSAPILGRLEVLDIQPIILSERDYPLTEGPYSGVGIQVDENASPTILNNILAYLDTGIRIDASSNTTVIGASIYQKIETDPVDRPAVPGSDPLGEHSYLLEPDAPLFVRPDQGNFYLSAGSLAIDNSVESLNDRLAMRTVRDPLGIDPSPIKAPKYDMFGQLRFDDPSYSPPTGPGTGGNVFADRGAIDRVDREGPTAGLIHPLDNDAADRDRDLYDVFLVDQTVTYFNVQLNDHSTIGQEGSQVADYTIVDASNELLEDRVVILQDGIRLEEGLHYIATYNAIENSIRLAPVAGIWTQSSTYTIILDNQNIMDQAGNVLRPNRPESFDPVEWPDATTYFTVAFTGFDFGDAPDRIPASPELVLEGYPEGDLGYPSNRLSDGARHIVYPGFFLGPNVDTDADAVDTLGADGDEHDDGVVFDPPSLIPGELAHPIVTVTADSDILPYDRGWLYAWFDFDHSGTWEADEKVIARELGSGIHSPDEGTDLSFVVPTDALPGPLFARFRFSSASDLQPYGEAPDGEVEDYMFEVVDFLKDYGDAPAPYPTRKLDDGAWHRHGTDVFLGLVAPDADPNGQPNDDATGDDILPVDLPSDEDGVALDGVQLVAGGQTEVLITVSNTTGSQAYVSAWIDFNADGDWDDAWADGGEHVLVDMALAPGEHLVPIQVPSEAVRALTFARFRISTQPGLSYTGGADDGEVEDYQVEVVDTLRDYGDAPEPYPTLFEEDGARHRLLPGMSLGSIVDTEFEAWRSDDATGDDTNPASADDDEDGVQFTTRVVPGEEAVITVDVTNAAGNPPGYLNAWLDFNRDGDWDDEGEKIAVNVQLATGSHAIPFNVPDLLPEDWAAGDPIPAHSDLGWTTVRVRYSSQQDLLPTGEAIDGEVEDHQVEIVIGDVTISGWKFDDRNANGVWEPEAQYSEPEFSLVAPGSVIMTPNDDGSTEALDLGFMFEFFGHNYTQFYINNNGNITFNYPLSSFTPDGFPQFTPIVAPFWADVDTRGTGNVRLAQGTTDEGHPFIQVDWMEVGYFSQHTDKRNTFTLYIEDDPAGDVVALVYHNMQWTTGDIGGINGFGGEGAQIGFDAGDGTNYISVMRPNSADDLDEIMEKGFYAFRFDPNAGTPVGGGEPGLAGVPIYLDMNEDGRLNYNDLNGNLRFDPGIDEALEPYTITQEDNLDTPDVNERGYYEFVELFPDDYTIREIRPEGWDQTGPNQDGLVLDNGAVAHYVNTPVPEGWYTATLLATETASDLNFGNYRRGEVTIADISVAEGHAGPTEVVLTLQMSDSFGAPVEVFYETVDGDGTHGPAATAANNDYVPASGSVVFEPGQWPGQNWTTTTLTSNHSNDYDFDIAGSLVVWQEHDGNDWEIFLYDADTDRQWQLTDNQTDEMYATVADGYVVWAGYSAAATLQDPVITDLEIFYFDYAAFAGQGKNGDPADATFQLTHNAVDDKSPRASDVAITWWTDEPSDIEIYYYDIAAGGLPRNISRNAYDDFNPRISGDKVVWTGYGVVADPANPRDSEKEIFVYDGASGLTTQLTNNAFIDRRPQVDGATIIWERYDENDWEIFARRLGQAASEQVTSNEHDDLTPMVSGNNIVWAGYDGTDWEVFHKNLEAGGNATNLSNNIFFDEHPQIQDNQVVWHRHDGQQWEVFFYEIGGEQWPSNVSDNESFDWYPQLSDSLVAWRGYDGEDYEIIIARPDRLSVTATITLQINGDRNIEPDETFFVQLTGATFADLADNRAVIAILNDDAGENGFDYGDAPQQYPVLLADNGARHVINPAVYLGGRIDAEGEGRPSADAAGDDNRTSDDEDGVAFNTILRRGGDAQVTVTTSTAGRIDAWIDFNGDGDWDDPSDRIAVSRLVSAGETTIPLTVPPGAIVGDTFARFRFSTLGGLAPTGSAPDGEVEDYRVHIYSAADPDVRTLNIAGTDGDDTFEFTPGDVYRVVLNGVPSEYLADQYDTVVFTGGLGRDTATLHGDSGDNTAELGPGTARLEADGVVVEVAQVETIALRGEGGNDTALFRDSAGDDTFVGFVGGGLMFTPDAQYRADGFTIVEAIATEGLDVGKFYDSPGDDTYVAGPVYANLAGTGFSMTARQFDAVHAYSTAGGTDIARLYDSDGNDVFAAGPIEGTLFGEGFFNRAKFFEAIHAYGTAGGVDTAKLYDSKGNDTFAAGPVEGTLFGEGFFNRAKFFDGVHAYATAGGVDTAKLYDSDGDDTFFADPTQGALYGDGFYNRAKFFDGVHAYATADGHDTATLRDSAGNDTFFADDRQATFYGDGFYNRAKFFEEVNANSTAGGADRAELHDSAMADLLEADDDWVRLSSGDAGFSRMAEDFAYVKATSQNDTGDKKEVVDYIHTLELEGYWED